MTTLHEIGASIKNYRKKRGLTSSSLAERSNIHRNTLSALEHGTGNVELNTLLALCQQLGLDLVIAPKQVSSFVRREEAAIPLSPGEDLTNPESLSRLRQDENSQRPRQERELTALQKHVAARLASVKREEGRQAQSLMALQESMSTSLAMFRTGQDRGSQPTALQKRISASLAYAGTAKPKPERGVK